MSSVCLELVQQQIDRVVSNGESLYVAHPLDADAILYDPIARQH